ncbi:hypothetical protein DDZ16_05545 [Marinilabilia rubra]|uniref:Uncharacterized protein n=1 Tax=Marinilabilia rubra TaxID=2162893 RepID=A0A2U2BBG7_9BACT|nr:hypothetical protein DDZ16_05545 [Marinilabilia rubra]
MIICNIKHEYPVIYLLHNNIEGLCPLNPNSFFVLTQKRNQKNYFMIIATLSIVQASMTLLSLIAIIQGCDRFTQKNSV